MKFSRHLAFVLCLSVLASASSVAAATKDEWVQVRSKNFFLIGNASEKEIRQVGKRLEQFRETFRLLFRSTDLSGSRPTNVVVFKSDSAYKPFKPKRADGKLDTEIAGYFQPGEDVNYITLSAGDKETFRTIFHEYIHSIIETNFGRSDVPQWFNEGLAEYYTTFEIADDQKAKLGLPQTGHLALLQQSKLMPLDMLLNTSNQQLRQSGGHSRSIFYAQSWALVHHIIQSGRSAALDDYLKQVIGGARSKEAFERAFQTTYLRMESDLRRYVARSTYKYHEVAFQNKLVYDTEMTASPLAEAEANAYLGDLLYHTNRVDDAEAFLLAALRLQPDSSLANIALGMVKLRQRKFDEARKLFERSIAGDPQNHIAYYQYAFLLNREARDEFGFVDRFEPTIAAKMRRALKKAIAIKPDFTESYELLAFVALVNNDELDEAAGLLAAAIKAQPGNQRYLLRLAEIQARQNKLDEATASAEKIAATADDPEIRSRADDLLNKIRQTRELFQQIAARTNPYAAVGRPPRLVRRIENVPEPSAAEMARMREDAILRSTNEALRVPLDGERRLVGRFEKITCEGGSVAYDVRTPTETITLTSTDFHTLALSTLDPSAVKVEVGCAANLRAFKAVITYKPAIVAKSGGVGELVAADFVPANFRLMTDEEMDAGTLVIYDEPRQRSPGPGGHGTTDTEIASEKRAMILGAMKDALRKPGEGESREIGFLEKIECSEKGNLFHIRTQAKTLRLGNSRLNGLFIKVFTPDLGAAPITCGIKPIEFPAVFIYAVNPKPKANADGELVSLEFMPKSFVLD
ncbi:MAG TPA: tetratricopeptide repeat protein [Pyrinomonadaceae bacterium]|nr:tetratricopeptide repeat protein [Pyrinomonadaceae bacterium]